jgi:hypothetical protein
MSSHFVLSWGGAGGFSQRAEPDEVLLEEARRRAPDQGCGSDRGCEGPCGRRRRRVSAACDLSERLLAALAVVASVCPRLAGALAVRRVGSLRARTGAEEPVWFSGHQPATCRREAFTALPRTRRAHRSAPGPVLRRPRGSWAGPPPSPTPGRLGDQVSGWWPSSGTKWPPPALNLGSSRSGSAQPVSGTGRSSPTTELSACADLGGILLDAVPISFWHRWECSCPPLAPPALSRGLRPRPARAPPPFLSVVSSLRRPGLAPKALRSRHLRAGCCRRSPGRAAHTRRAL